MLNVTGGMVNFLAGLTENSKTTSLWLGNAGTGTIKLSGGTITTQNGPNLARDNAIAQLIITGGLFDVQGTDGILAKTVNTGGIAAINIGTGNGILRESNSAFFSAGISLLFDYKSGGAFQLKTSTEPFAALAAVGQLGYQTTPGGAYYRLNNNPGDSSYYLNYLTESFNAGTGLYTLSVPEPSTWLVGALCAGAAGWGLVRRVRPSGARRESGR